VDAFDGFAQERGHGEDLRLRQDLILTERNRIRDDKAAEVRRFKPVDGRAAENGVGCGDVRVREAFLRHP
jgi:hypothetical protein